MPLRESETSKPPSPCVKYSTMKARLVRMAGNGVGVGGKGERVGVIDEIVEVSAEEIIDRAGSVVVNAAVPGVVLINVEVESGWGEQLGKAITSSTIAHTSMYLMESISPLHIS